MRIVNITRVLNDEDADKLGGNLLTDSHYDTLIREDADVYKPDGSPLLKYRANALSAAVCVDAMDSLREAASPSRNRGMAAGAANPDFGVQSSGKSTRFKPVRAGGFVSNTSEAREVLSGIIGFFDRSARMPFCRTTAYNLENGEKFAASLPFIREVDSVFRRDMPERYAAQSAKIAATHPEFVINGTAFTTITVNKNWQTAVHKDAGDLPEGFGVLSVLRRGRFDGCFLCFPKYRVAVDLQTRGVLLADVHEWHGNTPLRGKTGTYERISCVFYYRGRMADCGSPTEETERAKRLRGKIVSEKEDMENA
jgi:hypothetical protein